MITRRVLPATLAVAALGLALAPAAQAAAPAQTDRTAGGISGLFANLTSSVEGIGNQWQGDAATTAPN